MGIFGEAVLIRRGTPGKVDGIGLSSKSGNCPGASPNLTAIECSTSTIYVKAGQNLRDAFIKPEHYLNVASGVFRNNGQGIFGSNNLFSTIRILRGNIPGNI